MDIFNIKHLLATKKFTEVLKNSDFFVVSRQTDNVGNYESVAIRESDLLAYFVGQMPVQKETIGLACSDLTTALTTGLNKAYYDLPYNFQISEVIATLLTPQTAGTIFTVNIYKNGTTILSTLVTIDNNGQSSITAAAPSVISSADFVKGDRISVGISQIGNGTAKGLTVQLVGIQTQ